MVIQDLKWRIAALESILESAAPAEARSQRGECDESVPQSIPEGAAPMGAGDGAGDVSSRRDVVPPTAAVTLTPEQRAALGGISSNVRALIRCINHRHAEEQDRVLLALDDDDCDDDNAPANAAAGRNGNGNGNDRPHSRHDSFSSIRVLARTDSKREMLDDILGPERSGARGPQRRRRPHARRSTVAVDRPFGDETTPIPRELILGMMGDVSDQGPGGAGGGRGAASASSLPAYIRTRNRRRL